jgi:hypothetical protein
MTVHDLINRLKRMDQTLDVYFAHPSHDYWRSELASEVSSLDVEQVKHSSYHDQMVTADDRDEAKAEARGEELVTVLLLR